MKGDSYSFLKILSQHMRVLRKLTIRILGDRLKINIKKATLKPYYSSTPICSVEYMFGAILILLR